MKAYFKKSLIALFFIISLGIFFRTYNFSRGFSFAHDQDLYSWIAKDILVNHHLRLAGQVTSVDGVFIGPFFYYLMALSYFVFKMNPLGAVVPLTLIGVANIISFYFVFKKFFGVKAGIIGAAIEALSFGMAYFDRWSVPTQPTILWSIWFLFIILDFSRGKLKNLWLYAVLLGFFWSVHIALLPVLPIPIVVYFLSKGSFKEKLTNLKIKNVVGSLLLFLLVLSPLLLFEVKHNFSQTKSTIVAMQMKNIGPTGKQKVDKVLNASGREFQQRLIFGWEIKGVNYILIGIGFCLIALIWKKRLNLAQVVGITLWIFLIMLAQFTSKRPVSEYYFSNLMAVVILIISLFLNEIDKKLLLVLGVLYLGINTKWLFSKTDADMSYFYRKQIVDYIKTEVMKNNYACIAINYIADPGVGVGFRYLFWYEGVNLIKPNEKVPIYNIVIPWQISEKEINAHFGRFGVIVPLKSKAIDSSVCNDSKYTLDPLLGYTE